MTQADDARPSQVTDKPWLWAEPPTVGDRNPDLVGKWMVFVPVHLVDVNWRAVSDATRAGRLGIEAKVATAAPNPRARSADERPILVYTRDWRDREDVGRVLGALRQEAGITAKAFYKRDVDTLAGRYGDGVTVYVSPPGAAWFEGGSPQGGEPPRDRSTEASAPAVARPATSQLDPLADRLSQFRRRQAPVDKAMTLTEAVRAAFAEPKALLRVGAVVRLYGDLRDIQDDPFFPRWRRSPEVRLAPDAVTRIVDALPHDAGEAFLEEFSEACFAADIGEVGSLMVWPEGSPEPT